MQDYEYLSKGRKNQRCEYESCFSLGVEKTVCGNGVGEYDRCGLKNFK